MKKLVTCFASATLLAVAITGCGSSSGDSQAGTSNNANTIAADVQAPGFVDTPPPEPVPIRAEECDSPEVAVKTFLETLRAGDDRKAVSLLTNRARVETHKRGMAVQPPGSPNSTYAINGSEFTDRGQEAATVATVWTESGPGGEANYNVSWMVRLEPAGWRVAGLATELVPGKGPQPLNFEDPDDMQRQLEIAEAALAELDTSAVSAQAGPGDPGAAASQANNPGQPTNNSLRR